MRYQVFHPNGMPMYTRRVPMRFRAVLTAVAGVAAWVMLQPALPTHAETPLFTDITGPSGLTFTHTGQGLDDMLVGTGAAWIDYNRDRRLDLYVTRRVGANALFENQGGGTFVDVAQTAGVRDASHDGAGVAVADYDNDGWPDLYLANSDADVLYRNNGNGTFTNVTVAAGLEDGWTARGTSASWGDFDGDGWLDLYVVHYRHIDFTVNAARDRLFRSDGDGTFTDVTSYLDASSLDGYGFAGGWTDVDDDGDPDILIINDCPIGPRGMRMFRNDGDDGAGGWLFTDVTTEWGVGRCDNGMGLAIGDYNGDGRMDYLYSDIGNPTLLRNMGDRFEIATGGANLAIGHDPETNRPFWSWGANFFDYDLDGWLDLYVVHGANRSFAEDQPNVLCRNDGDGTFSVMSESGANDTDRARTSVVGDSDGDGDLDIYVVNYEQEARLFRNNYAGDNRFLGVRLEGVTSNRDGIGARLRLTAPDGTHQYREVHSGSSLGGGDEIAALFGIGAHARAVELLIRWPSGIVQRIEGPAGDQVHVIREPAAGEAEVSGVTASAEVGRVKMEWTAQFEHHVERFVVERRQAGEFIEAGSVVGRGTTMIPSEYSTTMAAIPSGSHTFRVRTDYDDGRDRGFSDEVTVEVPAPTFVTLRVRPNPSAAAVDFDLMVDRPQSVRVAVYDVGGRLVQTVFSGPVAAAGVTGVVFEGDDKPAGVYFLRATGTTFDITRKFLLVR
jgi:hypothetical protein